MEHKWSTRGNGYPETPERSHTWVSHKIHCRNPLVRYLLKPQSLDWNSDCLSSGTTYSFLCRPAGAKEPDTYLQLNPTSGPTGNLNYIVHSFLPIYIARGRYLRIS